MEQKLYELNEKALGFYHKEIYHSFCCGKGGKIENPLEEINK